MRADSRDDTRIAYAVAGQAHAIVTGDKKHLLSPGSYAGVPVVSRAGFLAMLEQRDDQECDGPPSRAER